MNIMTMSTFTKVKMGGVPRIVGRYLSTALVVLTSIGIAESAELKRAGFVSLPGQSVELKLEFDSTPTVPTSYVIDNPPRLVMDFWGASNGAGSRAIDVKTGVVDNLSFVEADGRLRVVANLYSTVGHNVELSNSQVVVTLDAASSPVARQSDAPVRASNTVTAQSQGTTIRDLDFKRLEGNQGRVIIDLSNDQARLDVNREGGNVVVTLSDTRLGDGMDRRFDVQDFATPLSFIDMMSVGGSTTILMRPSSAPFDYMAYQTGNQLFVDFIPLTRNEQEELRANQFPYSGERIDLNFQNVEVRAVLQIIAEVAEKNLVVSDNVGGTTTLRLKNVPWDQALDIILKSKNLDQRMIGNVLMVGTASEIAERERIEIESQKQAVELSPLLTEFVQIDFRRASDMKSRLEEARLITERGFLLADDQTNVLMIRETREQMEQIRRTLRRFDVQVSQVLVEARLVTASTEFARELGVRWGALHNSTPSGNDFSIGGGAGSVPGVPSVPGSGNTSIPSMPGMVDFGVGNPTSALRVGYLGGGLLLSAELSALQSDNKVEIISQPKVITTNGRPAVIKSGQEVAFQTVENGEVSLEFKEVVLSLEVTPQINPGDRISMDLKILQDSLDPNRLGGELLINTNQLETSVVVNDGDTIVLGGVFRNDIENEIRKTPVLGDLPVVGNMFRYKRERETKRELLIFITPTMIRESLVVQ
ncbi:Type IV pilus biogenesis and competence protein pilQ precursor [Nitrincola nitratireducens]|uniref:Type IV pilus biogenesis and competence protein pilQ n=2 Tax=Oceanospirillaceae TaxID=135620 RepID=W9USZ5_9GAMM|nr:Type IV pilus biogenesis and competence protein pilQ precursor [Nitrincola nitratireducens]